MHICLPILVCGCNINGSSTLECNLDGTCACNENIIGSKCNKCRQDYSGFPNCKGTRMFWAFLILNFYKNI